MLPLKKIVCPTDFSEPSYEALVAAEELANCFSAELKLVYVVEPIPTLAPPQSLLGLDFDAYLTKMDTWANEKLNHLIQTRVSPKVKAAPVVLNGGPSDRIVSYAKAEKADIIVIATHGRSGWRHFVFGSVSERVLRMSECPVLIIREP